METQELQKNVQARPQPEATRVRQFVPPVDIFENETELLVIADFAGVDPSTVNVRLDPPEFHIEGRVQTPGEETPSVYHRAFQIDERVDANGISASIKDGVLTVHVRKAQALQPRRIPVKAG